MWGGIAPFRRRGAPAERVRWKRRRECRRRELRSRWVPPELDEIITTQVGLTEREKADYRASLPQCGPCHALFDPYGLALDAFDAIGRHRTMDPEGRPIDPKVTLPSVFDRAIVSSPSEMAKVTATSDAFEACIALTYANLALADVSQGGAFAPLPGTARNELHRARNPGRPGRGRDASFTGLLVRSRGRACSAFG